MRRMTIILIVFCSFITTAYADPPRTDLAAWKQVDVVPMPKRIRLTDRLLPVAKAVIVLGEEPSEQDTIGAKWINDKIVHKGAIALPIVTEGAQSGDAELRIFVGTRGTCAAIDQAVREGLFTLRPGVPGKRGYVIEPRATEDGTDLLLGGADSIGALYACVTLAGLLEGEGNRVVIREAEIVDWPDYAAVTHGINLLFPEIGELGRRLRWAVTPSEKQEAEYLRVMKEHLDRLLERKYSCFKVDKYAIGPRYWRKLSPEFLTTYRKVTDYAKARGIRSLVYALHPCVGLRSELPDVPQRCLTGIGRDSYEHYVRCWSMDDERRDNAARLGKFLQAAGITDAGFHDWDTGAFLSPANTTACPRRCSRRPKRNYPPWPQRETCLPMRWRDWLNARRSTWRQHPIHRRSTAASTNQIGDGPSRLRRSLPIPAGRASPVPIRAHAFSAMTRRSSLALPVGCPATYRFWPKIVNTTER